MPDDATLAKLLSDALTHVESLKSQLAAADARAAHFERLALHHETRLRDAADVWSTLERTMLHARTELARVLPSSSSEFKPTLPAPAPTPRAAVVLPTAKTLSFPSLPPPPMHNPQRSVPAVATLAPATAPRSSPQPTTTTTTIAPAAAPSPATSTGQKRKRADSTDLDDELAAAVDGVSDSASEMSIDDMILAVSGPSPATEHPPTTTTTTTAPATAAAVPPPRKKPSPSAPATATTTGPAVVHASHNALGQRQCRACGQAGRYKDGKCVEKWGPGPAGPGTVCDRCRKKMKRVERRSDLVQQQQQQQQSSAAASPAPAPAAQSTAPTTPAPSTAAPSPHMRPSTASSSTLSTLSPLAEPERERERVVLPPAKSLGLVGLGLLSSPEPIPAPVVPQSRPFYDAAREVTSSSSASSASSASASHFGSSRRTSPAPSFAALAGLSGGGARFAYEPPTSSVRSYPVSAHRHWRDEVEPVS